MGTTSLGTARTEPLLPTDLVTAAGLVRAALRPLLGADWSVPAAGLDWSARQTLDHLPDTLLRFATQLATRARGELPRPRHGDQGLATGDLLTVTVSTANVLGAVAAGAGDPLPPSGLRGAAGGARARVDSPRPQARQRDGLRARRHP